MNVPAPTKGENSLLFCSIQALSDWMMPPHPLVQAIDLLSLLTQMLISSRNIPTDKPRNNVYQLSGHPLAGSTDKINHLHTPRFSVYFYCKISDQEGCHRKIFLIKVKDLYLKKETPSVSRKVS